MSAIAALKGYRTQFLYSLYFILSNQNNSYSYRLEGEEDLDILDEHGNMLLAIQVKNLSKTLTLSDLLAENKTSFLKRFVNIYPKSTPVLVSFGEISEDIKKWKDTIGSVNSKEKIAFSKYGISEPKMILIKEKILFEEVEEEVLTEQILQLLKTHKSIDPVPTAENLLYYIQYKAEKQQIITAHDIFETIEKMGVYLSERISYANQYGIYIKPLLKIDSSTVEMEKLKEEFYYGINARYEHIYCGIDVRRSNFLDNIEEYFTKLNIVVLHGASGQGKSTLAYRYVFDRAAQTLIYEINLQEDPVKTNEAIIAISALTKGLNVPVAFILHVAPNTISWLKIAREFSNHPLLRLIVTIRNEDWYRAQSAEIDFLYSDLEIELSAAEAELIFSNLESRMLIKKYVDFQEAWIDLNEGVPLLEFTHAITQGDSLRNRLRNQLAELHREENNNIVLGQLEFLRIISFADSLGARVDAQRVKHYPNIKVIIEKFEQEYLIKHSYDKKSLTGLHPIRSKLLVDLLFDDLVVCKNDYVVSCLKVIEREDALPFLLQCLHLHIIGFESLVEGLKQIDQISWSFYGAAAKSLLWAGIRNYIDQNTVLLDEIYEKVGDSWSIVTDIYHGDTLDLEEVLGSLPMDNNGLVDYARNIKDRLSPKLEVFVPIIKLFDNLDLPHPPKTYADWSAFAEVIFWLSQTKNKAKNLDNLDVKDFQIAFELLEVEKLSQLMLGMHYYSKKFNSIRLELAETFNEKLREKYCIPLLKIDNEVSFDFVINILNDELAGGIHDITIEIIEILRAAYPEKSSFKSQGHGHRMNLIPQYHDETTKQISAKSLPLDFWADINTNLRRLNDFSRRPEDWHEFHQRLEEWENKTKSIIQAFSKSFHSFKKLNSFTELVPVMNQMNFQSNTKLTTPKITVDPLGIPIKTKKQLKSDNGLDPSAKKEAFLVEKYRPFFKSYSDYKRSIETFITQSGKASYDVIKKRSDKDHSLDENNLRLTYINLYDAAAQRGSYYEAKEEYFNKFTRNATSISESEIFNVATTWKSFWTAIQANNHKRVVLTEGVSSIKNDFTASLLKLIRSANKNGTVTIEYINNKTTEHLPVFLLHAKDPLAAITAIKLCYDLIFQSIGQAEYVSLKYLMLQRYFSKFYFISEVSGYVFDYKWLELPLHLFLNTRFEELPIYRFMPYPIKDEVVSSMKLQSWSFIYPRTQEIQDLATDFSKLSLYVGHLVDLVFFDHNDELDEKGLSIIQNHFSATGTKVTSILNNLLDRLGELAKDFPENYDLVVDDVENEYWSLLLKIMKDILPTTSEDGSVNFNMEVLKDWSARLQSITQDWGIFMLLLQKKYLEQYLEQTT